jgi:hypothetical protein
MGCVDVVVDCARRRSADGRAAVDNAADLFVLRAIEPFAPRSRRRDAVSTSPPHQVSTPDTIVASWARRCRAIKASSSRGAYAADARQTQVAGEFDKKTQRSFA